MTSLDVGTIADVAAPRTASDPTPRQIHVLLVEDSAVDAELMVYQLRRSELDPVWQRVEDEGGFVEALQRDPDLILADYTLPQFSALRALDILHGLGRDIPLIVVTGTVGEEPAVECVKRGAADYLLKDRLARLGPAVTRALVERALREDVRKAEATIRRDEAFRAAIEHSLRVGILTVDVQGRPTYVNPAFCQMLGREPGALLDQHAPFDYWAPEDAGTLSEAFAAMLAHTPVADDGIEGRFTTSDDRRLDVVILPSPLTTTEGVSGWLMAVYDVTERKHLEERLRDAGRMEAIGKLAGGVAHNFNNTMTAILGYTDLLADHVSADSHAVADLREIRAAAERAATLTRQLLAFSGKQAVTLTPLNLSTIVREIEPMLRAAIGENITVDARLEEGLPLVMGDEAQLKQVLIELALNARDSMPGGGRLTVETREVIVEQPSAATIGGPVGSYVVVCVHDTGEGMTPEAQARVFEPFFKTTPRGPGTGLALAAVHGTIKQLKGFTRVATNPGRGSTFEVYLPTAERLAAAELPLAFKDEGSRPPPPAEPIAAMRERVRQEFREMPGLRLTHEQARRLWTVATAALQTVVAQLMDERFLCRMPCGRYAREKRTAQRVEGVVSPAPPAGSGSMAPATSVVRPGAAIGSVPSARPLRVRRIAAGRPFRVSREPAR